MQGHARDTKDLIKQPIATGRQGRLPARRALLLIAALALGVAYFVWGALRQAHLVNTDMAETDQSAYLAYAKRIATIEDRGIGERNRMPVYPYLMSLFHDDAADDEAFFETGKRVGIGVGILLSGGAFVLLSRFGQRRLALTATLIAAFSAFAFKAPYFQTELLYYGISFAVFCLCLSLAKRPSILTALATGGLSGVAFLTKASILPALGIAGGVLVVVSIFQTRGLGAAKRLRSLAFAGLCLLALAGSFLVVTGTYLANSKQAFGQYFYNVNSTFYLWYDSWEQAKEGTRAYGDRLSWPDMPADEIPSFRKYVAEHSLLDMAARLLKGFVFVVGVSLVLSYGYGPLALLLLAAAAAMAWQNRRHPSLKERARENVGPALFSLLYFGAYLTLYAWYCPIACGNRFNLSLLLPALALAVYTLSQCDAIGVRASVFGRQLSVTTINKAALAALALYLVAIYPWLTATMYAGE